MKNLINMIRLKEITKLDEKINRNDLVCRYKGKSPDEKFDKYDNALELINKIQNGEIKLSDVKNNQMIFKSHLSEITKGSNKKYQKSKKTLYTILKCFTKQETSLLSFMMIIL